MEDLRENIKNTLLTSHKRHFVLELATGTGKTLLALTKANQLYSQDCKILIVIPRNVLIQNWIDEFKKWNYEDMLSNVIFVTYVSLPKMAGLWDIVIFDECHHLSERCREALQHFEVKHGLFLSATLKREHKEFIREWCKENVEVISVSTKKAIDNDVLPDPKILLYPIELDSKTPNCIYYPKEAWKKLPTSKIVYYNYEDRWKAKRIKKTPYALKCTQEQYYEELDSLIHWYKNKNYNPVMKNLWLHKCGERLQWLSGLKAPLVRKIIIEYTILNYRMVIFCNTIEQSKEFSCPCVNSKVGTKYLDMFNKKQIDILAAVNCLNEGINLVDCQVGIFDSINSSPVMQVQKQGRLLRHKNPILIIPYFVGTREEEIIKKWFEDYDKSLIYEVLLDDKYHWKV